jgi:ABC-type metal ion transport system substrate-binding protein
LAACPAGGGKALFESYRNDTVKAFINDTFKGSAIAS